MKSAAKGQARQAGSGGGALSWLQGLLCGGLLVAAPGMTMLTALLVAPGLAVIAMERDPSRPVARAMLLLGAAASVAPLHAAMATGPNGSLLGLCEPADVALAWAAAGGGWLLAQLAPVLAGLTVGALLAAERARLSAEAERLRKAWTLPG